ncbi:MAG: uracil-DNA glycosylase [Lentisphaeria bacterium]
MLKELIPDDWALALADEFNKDYFLQLNLFVKHAYNNSQVFPQKDDIFSALSFTSFNNVKVVILGQDPYHDDNQAHGLAFSVKNGCKIPPSLRNIFKELSADLNILPPISGDLSSWATQGVLLLNTVLTVQAHMANSHKKQGWEIFTDAIISKLNLSNDPIVFVLWGSQAISKKSLITNHHHFILQSVHPSPLSASKGFLGSKPFSQINSLLAKEITWSENNQPSLF